MWSLREDALAIAATSLGSFVYAALENVLLKWRISNTLRSLVTVYFSFNWWTCAKTIHVNAITNVHRQSNRCFLILFCNELAGCQFSLLLVLLIHVVNWHKTSLAVSSELLVFDNLRNFAELRKGDVAADCYRPKAEPIDRSCNRTDFLIDLHRHLGKWKSGNFNSLLCYYFRFDWLPSCFNFIFIFLYLLFFFCFFKFWDYALRKFNFYFVWSETHARFIIWRWRPIVLWNYWRSGL